MSEVKKPKSMTLTKLCLTVLGVALAGYAAMKGVSNDAEAQCAAKHCDRGAPKLIRGQTWECLCVEVPR